MSKKKKTSVLSRKPGLCSFCGNVNLEPDCFDEQFGFGDHNFSVHCSRCGAHGPWKGTKEAAIRAWNKQIINREQLHKAYDLGYADAKAKFEAEKAKRQNKLEEMFSIMDYF